MERPASRLRDRDHFLPGASAPGPLRAYGHAIRDLDLGLRHGGLSTTLSLRPRPTRDAKRRDRTLVGDISRSFLLIPDSSVHELLENNTPASQRGATPISRASTPNSLEDSLFGTSCRSGCRLNRATVPRRWPLPNREAIQPDTTAPKFGILDIHEVLPGRTESMVQAMLSEVI